jgi:hypothetical protein
MGTFFGNQSAAEKDSWRHSLRGFRAFGRVKFAFVRAIVENATAWQCFTSVLCCRTKEFAAKYQLMDASFV